MHFEPTYESVHQHKLPKWYDDAKFGIFIHWSLFSVPAFAAEQTKTISSADLLALCKSIDRLRQILEKL